MKKLFATFLMLIVALAGWATINESSDGNTVTLTYVDDGNSNDQNYSLQNRSATTVVLTGDWANKDLTTIGKIVGQCNSNVFLDMSACQGFVSKVQYPGTDWTGENYQLVYSNGTQTVNVTKSTVYVDSNGNQYNGTVQQDSEGYYYAKWMVDGTTEAQQWQIDQANSGTLGARGTWNTDHTEYTYYEWYAAEDNHGAQHVLSMVKTRLTQESAWSYQQNGQTIYVDESQVTQTSDTTGTATVPAQATPFSLAGGNFNNATNKLSGIAFPNSENFTAIPDYVFGESGPQNLASVTNGSYVTWIGRAAFKNSKITTFNFNANLKVIGGEAFHGAPLTAINLSACTSLQAIKFEAFEEVPATTVTFPGESNFTFLGNDAFRKSGITSLDMSMCAGITEFQAYGSSYRTFSECAALKSVKLPPYLTAIPDDSGSGVFAASKAIESLEFTGTGNYVDCVLQNPCTIGSKAFESCSNLATIKLSNNISYIGEEAFREVAITEIHIPASVEELAKHCFYNCDYLTIVYFDEFDACDDCDCVGANTKIAGGAGSGGQGQASFEECSAITDVYINTLADLQCGNNGFDQDITWGAGDAGADFAMLHYPKEKVEHYVNLHHYLTDEIVANAGRFHNWLEEHYYQAIVPHKNGWYEFINSGPTIPNEGPELQDIVLRTFSDWDYAYLVPNGIRAYVVNNIELLDDGNYEVSLQRLRVIPKRTGVILYGHPNSKSQDNKPALVFTPVKFLEHGDPIYEVHGEGPDAEEVQVGTYDGPDQGAPLCRANWNNLDESHMKYKNYLEPIITSDGSRVAIKPYETVKVNGKTKTTFRNFGLGRYTSTDYYKNDVSTLNDEKNFVGFFRMKPQNYNSGYAYLRLRADVDEEGHTLPYTDPVTEEVYVSELPVASSGEILVKPDEPVFDKINDILPYHYEYKMSNGEAYDAQAAVGDTSLNPKGWWDKNADPIGFYWEEMTLSWGDRSKALKNQSALKYFGELEEDADGMAKIVIPADDVQDVYYTLQGVRVTNPTKGVYILNGKKVIVK